VTQNDAGVFSRWWLKRGKASSKRCARVLEVDVPRRRAS